MHRPVRIVQRTTMASALAILLAPVALGGAARPSMTAARQPSVASPDSFTVQRIGDGVYAFVRREPPGMALNSNSVAIVRDSDVVVVDAEFTAAAARGVIAALRHITRLPVAYVVNTHWHDDHTAGDRAYEEAYPGVHFVAHVNTANAMRTTAVANRKLQLENGPAAVARIRHLADVDSTLAGGVLSPAERASYRAAAALFDEYVREAPTFRAVIPDVTFTDSLILGAGAHRVEVRYYGRGNTEGDAVVYVPAQRILVTGDLLVAPTPLAFNSHPREWIGALDHLLALRPAIIVPGHGPVMTDTTYLARVRDLLVGAVAAVDSARARGLTLEQTRDTVTLASYREAFAGSDPLVRWLFETWTRRPLVTQAFSDTLSPPRT